MNTIKSIQTRLRKIRNQIINRGNIFQRSKNIIPSKSNPGGFKDRSLFTVINDEGYEVFCDVLFTFDNADETRHYIVYTDNAMDEEGNIQVYASIYNTTLANETELLPIETSEEWAMIEEILSNLQIETKSNETDNSKYFNKENNNEVLCPIYIIILNKICVISYKYRFPVGILPLYLVGIILFHFACSDSLPIMAEIGFVTVELLLMKGSYDDIYQIQTATAWCITMNLYMWLLFCFLNPLVVNLFPNIAGASFEPWAPRSATIILSIVLLLRAKLIKQK